MANAIKNPMKKPALCLIIFIVVINIPPVKYITGPDDILYSNANGTFTFNEANFTGRNYSLCIDNFNAFKSVNKKDTILYRISHMNIAKIWRWGDYLTKEKYKLPYKAWKEIEGIRGPIVKTSWQAF
jgi:hypothetical protein